MTDNELRQEILRLKNEKNAVILGHYYQRHEIQDLSDYIGDSLALAQKAQEVLWRAFHGRNCKDTQSSV